MKKMNYLLLFLTSFYGFSQMKSTGVVPLGNGMNANLTLNVTTSKATLVLVGPSDRYFALQFGAFGSGNGMKAGEDVVYFNGTTLVDGNMLGVGPIPNTTENQDWTVVSNVMNGATRTITASRNFVTGDTKDFTFLSSATTIDFVWATSSTASYNFGNHGGSNRGYAISRGLTTLGVEDFSLAATSVYPNPSNGNFSISAKSGMDKINVYTQVGAFVKTIELPKNSLNAEVSLNGFQTGIYLIELEGETGKAWKKIAVNN